MKDHVVTACKAAVAGVVLAAATAAARPEPFKLPNIHFETNASACDMGIQISFDTDGTSRWSTASGRSMA